MGHLDFVRVWPENPSTDLLIEERAVKVRHKLFDIVANHLVWLERFRRESEELTLLFEAVCFGRPIKDHVGNHVGV